MLRIRIRDMVLFDAWIWDKFFPDPKVQSEWQLAIRCLIANYSTRWRCIFEGPLSLKTTYRMSQILA
ncbi:MAG: hypothetical protein ACK559_36100, partial [bacterium]